jgi:hypothetical protein
MLVAVTTTAATTGTAAVAGPAVDGVPVLPSTQVAEPPRVSVWAVAGAVHPDQVRLETEPTAFTGTVGGVVHVVPVSIPPVTLAAAPPVLARVKVTVNVCPAMSVDGDACIPDAVTPAGACTITLELAVFDVTALAGVFASVPDAEAESMSVPSVGAMHLE